LIYFHFRFEKAAIQGHQESILCIVCIYEYGEKGIKRDINHAIYWYKKCHEFIYYEHNDKIPSYVLFP
jgi:hypothetical protein